MSAHVGRVTRFWPLIVATLIVAAGLRLWQVGDWPPGLHYDEAADTIIAAQIARGESAPIFVEAYTGKEVLFFYWAAAWMKLVGPTAFAMRLAAAMAGVLTVAATYRAVREMFHPRALSSGSGGEGVALLAAMFMAASFWHVLMSRLGFRSISEPLLQALALAALFRGLRLNRLRWCVIAGLLIGLNLYTYLAARLFPVAIAIIFAFFILFDRGRRLDRLTQLVVTVAAAVMAFLPLGVYFAGHPQAFLTRIQQVAPQADQLSALIENIGRALGMFFISGDPYIRFNLPDRPLFPAAWGALFALGVIVALIGVWRGRTLQRRGAYFSAIVIGLIMLLPTALAVNEISPSNLRAIGLMPGVFVFPALGAWWLLRQQRARWPATPRPLMWLILLTAAVETGWTYFGVYVKEPQLYVQSDGDLADIARWLNTTDLGGEQVYVAALHYRHPTVAALSDRYGAIKWLTGDQTIVLPAKPAYLIFSRLALPDQAWLQRFLPPADLIASPTAPDGQTNYLIYHIAAAPNLTPQVETDVNYGNIIRLIGYDLEPMIDRSARVTLYWRVLNPPDRGDYSTFAQLRDARGFEWGQTGSFAYPSEEWTPGEVIVQRLDVPAAAGAPPNDYELRVGWLSQSADARLNVVAADGGFGGTVARVTPIRLGPDTLSDPAALALGTRLDREVRPGLTLLGDSLETRAVKQGAPIYFTLFWQNSSPLPDVPLKFELASCGCSGEAAMTRTLAITSTAVAPGSVLADRYGLRVPADLPAGDYTLDVTVEGRAPVPVGNLSVEKIDRVWAEPPVAVRLMTSVSNDIELVGYTIEPDSGSIRLTLVWRAQRAIDRDWTVFTHALNAAGQVTAGQDNQPVNGTYPTSWWQPGEYVIDTYTLKAAPDQPIEIGLYDPETGERAGPTLRLK